MKYMVTISYDGSKFHGFQRQNNVVNVQGTIESELSKILDEKILIKGAGRTDALVHAKCQVFHFETNKKVNHLKKKLNQKLKNIKIKKIKKVSSNFHSRHSAKEKEYLYKIDLSGKRNSNYYCIVPNDLDIKKMKKSSKLFLGTHNFQNFVAGNRDNYNTTINKIRIYKFNNVIYLKFSGYAFYRYMVRNLVGALIEIGKGKINENTIEEMLEYPNIDKRLPTAKPNGLYLYKIKY